MTLLACGSSTETPNPAGGTAEVLAEADAHDGVLDKTVSDCSGCGLGMPGDPAHAVEHEGYELHFCSETCKSNFESDPAAGVERIEAAVKKTH